MILLLLALQAATPATPAPPQEFSILLPQCQSPADNGDIVVCERGANSPRIPLPDERGPPTGRGANRDMTGTNVLALENTPCAAQQKGCTVGVNIFGPPVMLARLVTKAINPKNECCEGDDATNPFALARDAVNGIKGKRRIDKTGRVAIPLDDAPPAGSLVP